MRVFCKRYGPDILVGTLFLSVAITLFLLRWKFLVPFPFLVGDAATYAGFAAALDNPEMFVGDPLLGNLGNINFYLTFHIPLTRLLARILELDYGSAWLLVLIPQVFLQLSGFYILGRVLFGSRWAGLCFSLLTLARIQLNFGTFWGFNPDPLARTTFQSGLPFLLAGALWWRNQPSRWPVLMVLAGVLMYVHPVSTPVWALAVWAGLWFGFERDWSFQRRIGWMCLCGGAFLVVAGPFVFNYLSTYEHGETLDYERVYAILKARYLPGYFDLPQGLRVFCSTLAREPLFFMGIFAVGAIAIRKKTEAGKAVFNLMVVWFCVLLLFSVAFPLAEQAICRKLKLMPPEVDLIRNIRYLVLFLEIAVFALLWPRVFPKSFFGWLRLTVFAVCYFAIVVPGFHASNGVLSVLDSAGGRNYFRASARDQFYRDMLSDVAHLTAPGTSILAYGEHFPLALRYAALRPVVYTYKDGGVLGYANHRDLLEWDSARGKFQELQKTLGIVARDEQLIMLAFELNAEALVLPFELSLADQGDPRVRLLKQWRYETQSIFLYELSSTGLSSFGSSGNHTPLSE